MNKYYGKGISLELQREISAAQNKYGLNDLQTSGILQAMCFIGRVADLDHDNLYEVEVEVSKGETVKLPHGVKEVLSGYPTMRAARKHFCQMERHKVFGRFADKLLSKPLKLSDYLAHGVLRVKKINVEVRAYE